MREKATFLPSERRKLAKSTCALYAVFMWIFYFDVADEPSRMHFFVNWFALKATWAFAAKQKSWAQHPRTAKQTMVIKATMSSSWTKHDHLWNVNDHFCFRQFPPGGPVSVESRRLLKRSRSPKSPESKTPSDAKLTHDATQSPKRFIQNNLRPLVSIHNAEKNFRTDFWGTLDWFSSSVGFLVIFAEETFLTW